MAQKMGPGIKLWLETILNEGQRSEGLRDGSVLSDCFLCGPLRISAISAIKLHLTQSTQRIAEKNQLKELTQVD